MRSQKSADHAYQVIRVLSFACTGFPVSFCPSNPLFLKICVLVNEIYYHYLRRQAPNRLP